MHSRVFQISTMQIDKKNYLNEDTLNQGDNSFYDYCADISDEERKEEITNSCCLSALLNPALCSMSEASLIITSDGICRIATRYHAGGFTQLI